MQKVNTDLIGKIVNIPSRISRFININFNSNLLNIDEDNGLFVEFLSKSKEINSHYEVLEYKKVIIEILNLANKINRLIDLKKPWVLIKNKNNEHEVQYLCSLCLNLYRILIFYLNPITPSLCKKSREFLNIEKDNIISIRKPLFNHKINIFKNIMERINDSHIKEMKR